MLALQPERTASSRSRVLGSWRALLIIIMEAKESKPVAAGSIWNPNSWHWEMKNYTEVAKKLVEDKVRAMEVRDADVAITNTAVRFPRAEAEVNIRKGKQYLLYEFDLEVDFAARSKLTLAQNELADVEATGSYKVREITHDDPNDLAVDDVRVTQKTPLAERVKAFLKKNLRPLLMQLFKNFAEDLAKFESDPAKLEADRRKREEAQLATQKARQQNGQEKERLLQEQAARELQMKAEFANKQ